MQIAVIGGEDADERALRLARQVGKEIAKQGHILVCGGRGGVMAAAAQGAKEAEGLVVGILPGEDDSDANAFLDVKVRTGIGFARNACVALTGDAVIAVAGGCGTLSEIGLAWAYGKRIVALITSGGWAERMGGERIDDRRDDYVLAAKTPKEAVELATLLAADD